MRFINSKNEQIEKGIIDGYSFGDRLLDGVMFEVIIVNNALVVVGVTPECQSYFDDLNKEKWLARAQDFIKDMIHQGEVCNIFLNCSLEITNV